MTSAPLAAASRLAALRATGLVPAGPAAAGPAAEPALDRLARLAAHLVGAPVALVSLVDDRAQYFPGLHGLGGWAGAARGTPLSHSLCQHVVTADAPLVLPDAPADPRVRDSLAVTELGVAAYCGVPIRTADGHVLGTVCAADGAPHAWSERDLAVLGELAEAAAEECALRAANGRLEAREAALAAQTRELEAVFAAMHDVVLVLDRDGVYRRVVPTAPELLYRPPEEVVGRRVHDVFAADDADRFLAAIREALATGRPTPIAYALELPALGCTWFEATVSVLDARAGLVLWVARDVSARVRAEGALRASEERFRGISAASPVGIFHAGLDGHVTYANPRLAEIWGMAPEAMHGRGWLERLHPDDVEPLLAGWTAANARGEEFAIRFRLRRDTTRWVHGRSAVIRDARGRAVGSVGTVEDVTARVLAEAATGRLTAILEAMPEVVATATPEGRVEYLNAAGRRLLGIAGGAEAVPAARLAVADVQPQFAPGGREAGAIAAALRDGSWRGETVLTKCDGREIPVEQVLLAHRAVDDPGRVEYVSTVLRDITERKQTEATLRAFALVDELTGLYNRRGFLSLAGREWEAATARGDGVVLLYLDLDGFKAINDTYGHAEGDRALAATADVLRATVRERDVVGRLGGDEFVVLARCGAGQAPLGTAERLEARFAQALAAANAAAAAAGRPYAIRSSVGVAAAGADDPDRPGSLAALLERADGRLYDVKAFRRAA